MPEQLASRLILLGAQLHKCRFELSKTLRKYCESPLRRVWIEYLLLVPFALAFSKVAHEQRHPIQGDIRRHTQKLPRVLIVGVQLDQPTVDALDVFVRDRRRRKEIVKSLDWWQKISHHKKTRRLPSRGAKTEAYEKLRSPRRRQEAAIRLANSPNRLPATDRRWPPAAFRAIGDGTPKHARFAGLS